LGWLILIEAMILLSTVWWPIRPYAAVMGVALPLAIIANALISSWQLSSARLSVRVPQRVHVNDEVNVILSASSDMTTLPVRLESTNLTNRKPELIGRVSSLGPTPAKLSWEVRFPQRGLITLPPIVARMDQPFGLVEASRVVGDSTDILVLPAIGFVRRDLRTRLSKWLEQTNSGTETGDDELSHLRDYRPGDARHSIHWRASARNRTLLVTERNAPTCRQIALVLDTNLRGQSNKKLESLICAAATLVDHLSRRNWLVTLHGAFAPLGVIGGRNQVIEALALVQADSTREVQEFVPGRRSSLVLALNEPELPALQPPPLVLTLAECENLVRLPKLRR
jgi:uncharacterized protein (DUF58 family)